MISNKNLLCSRACYSIKEEKTTFDTVPIRLWDLNKKLSSRKQFMILNMFGSG